MRPTSGPKYYVVKRHLLEVIAALTPGAPVPTERELRELLSTSRTTVRQALSELVQEGRVIRKQGSGTFVAEPKVAWPLHLTSFTDQMNAAGFTPSAKVLTSRRVHASANLARRLALAPDAMVYRIERTRFANSCPVAVDTSWLSADRFPGLTEMIRQNDSLHDILAHRYMTRIQAGDETIETAPATPHQATTLQVEVGSPLLVVSGLRSDADGVPVEYGQTRFRGDRVRLLTRLATSRP